jgi:tetratricopeptide (TPR) repeat protein
LTGRSPTIPRRSGSIPSPPNNRGAAYAAKHDYDRAIADFDEAIRLDPKSSSAIGYRGFAYDAKQDYDRAIADYNEAIRLDPKSSSNVENRGAAYAAKQDYNRAIADYTEAIRLDSKSASAFSLRCRAYAAKLNFDHTIEDCSTAIKLDPDAPNAVLWLYIARKRTGVETAAAELEANAKGLKRFDWPYPIIELFLGRRTAQTVLSAATKSDEKCQANLHVGELSLLRGEHPAAKKALRAAADLCPKNLVEYAIARAELERLR